MEKALGREVRIANDANCFALSEAVDGAAQGADVVFGVILGTGVGGGVVVRGEVLTGPNAIAGEWGHNPLPLPRKEDLPLPDCYCGRKGCIETYLSGPAMQRDPDMDRYEERLARARRRDQCRRGNIEHPAAVCERTRFVEASRLLGPRLDPAGPGRARGLERSARSSLALGTLN